MPEPARMARVTAVLLERDEPHALRALGLRGLVHLVHLPAGPDTAPRALDAGTAAPWEALPDRLERLRAALGLPAHPAGACEERGEEVVAEVERAEARVAALAGRRDALRAHREELSRDAARLDPWCGLELPASRVGARPLLVLRVGRVPAAALAGARQGVGRFGLLLAAPAQRDARQAVVVLGAGRDASALDAVLRAADFEEEVLPHGEGTLDERAAALRREEARAEEDQARLEAEVRSSAEELAQPLAAIEARARLECRMEEARRCLPRTRTALLLQGWTPVAEAATVERCLREATEGRCILECSPPAPAEEDDVPVLLRSSRLLRPFAALVAGFGLPRYRELSPTPFLAVSFLAMFGVMFGDVGHGAVLAVAGLCGLAARRWRDAGVLLLLCGLSAAAGGVVYGSYFGLERFRPLALWRDPLEGDPLSFLILGMGLGVLTISLGLALNVANRFRQGQGLTALLGRFGLAGLAFYWTALALLACGARGLQAPWPAQALLALSVAAWLVADRVEDARQRRRGAPSRGGGLLAGLVEAFETILVYLANTISFVRLAAYGMSHAALLVAIVMAARAAGRPGGLGFAAVMVFGNAVAIVLEGVIAAVQALRLEYYEFFSKFFSGAGRPFAPFRLEPTGGAR